MNRQVFRIISGIALAIVLAASSANGQQAVASPCNNTPAPVVFVHGFLGSGDTWATQVHRFASNCLFSDRFFAFDWNSLSGGGADLLLDRFIDSVLIVTKAQKLHLVGHSAEIGRASCRERV